MIIRYLNIIFLTILSGCLSPKIYYPDRVDVRLKEDLMFLTLSINDKKGVFLIDTGAGISFVDLNQAKRYGFYVFDNNNQGTIHGIGGSGSLLVTSNIQVKYEGISYRGFNFYASDMSMLNNYFAKRNMRILGIVGADFLAKSGAVIDYRNRSIFFKDKVENL